jgi:CP family cyanate transporter-like MFS transporter
MIRGASFLIALLVVAANLRPSLTGVGPLLRTIQQDLSLSSTAAGLLSSLPLLAFAGFAPLATLARQHGAERILLAGLLVLIAGTLLRSEGSVVALFGGTVLLGTGIAVINVLLPTLIKQHYPEHVPTITTAYATTMGAIAALGSGVAVPLAQILPGGWRSSLASWALLAAIGVVFWLPHLRAPGDAAGASAAAAPRPHPPWRTTLAWQVTSFMGLQSTLFYIAISWYPAILRDNGFSASSAGWLLTLFQVAALLAGLPIPMLIRRFMDQRGLALTASLLVGVATLGILVAPRAAAVWMIVAGAGAGPGLILALSFMGLRASNSATAAALSLMAQSLGYLLAACGPIAFGFVHDHVGGWSAALLFAFGISIVQGLCGMGAGRAAKI